jgi:hypothetical protein
MGSLGDAFPDELKKEFAKSNIELGTVIKIYDSEAKKEKWHLIVGMDDGQVLIATVRINSEINIRCIPQSLRCFQIHVKKQDNYFLDHDSFVDCSKLLSYPINHFIDYIQKNTSSLIGKMEEKKFDEIRSTIAICHIIENKYKKKFGLK